MAPPREMYKTRLCQLYLRGSCQRQSCSFAHGGAELRRFSAGGSFNGRHYRRGNDLRERLHRRRSPFRSRYDERQVRNNRRSPHNKGHSRSASPDRRSPSPRSPTQKRRGTKRLYSSTNAHYSDVSGESLGADDNDDARKSRGDSPLSSSPFDSLEEELQMVDADIEALNDQKLELEVASEKNSQENDKCLSQNKELESKLTDARLDFKRLGSKIKKLIKVYMRQSRAQEEMTRAQTKLQKLVDELPLEEDNKLVMRGEDSDVNIVSDGEPEGFEKPVKKTGREVDSHPFAVAAVNESDPSTMGKSKKSGLRKRACLLQEIAVKTMNTLLSDDTEVGTKRMHVEDNNLLRYENPAKLTDAHAHSDVVFVDGLSKVQTVRENSSQLLSSPPLEKGNLVILTKREKNAEDPCELKEGQFNMIIQEKGEVNWKANSSKSFQAEDENLFGYSPTKLSTVPSNHYVQYKGEDEEVDVEAVDNNFESTNGGSSRENSESALR